MKTVQVVYFFFESRQIQNLQLNLRKENVYILSFFLKKLPHRLIFYSAYNMDKGNEYSSNEFFMYYPKDRETSDVETETGITERQEAIDDFINEQKSTNTNQKKTATDMNQLSLTDFPSKFFTQRIFYKHTRQKLKKNTSQ